MSSTDTSKHPYSQARMAGGFVFASGALSVDSDDQPVAGRRAALDAALLNVERRLATEGAALTDVLRLTYYVVDLTLRDEANDQLMSVFSDPRPARTFLGVNALPYGATVEIEAIAYKAPA